jgi:hypothetical protein
MSPGCQIMSGLWITLKCRAEPDMQKYLAEILEWYGGEIGGEAFFSALAQGTVEPALADKWRKLAQLERYVAGQLCTALEARGVQLPPATADRQRGVDSAKDYASLTWREALTRLRPELVGYVRAFQAAESRMPEEILPLARLVTEHERALLEFVTCELDQGGRHSLDRVLSLLGEANGEQVLRQPGAR